MESSVKKHAGVIVMYKDGKDIFLLMGLESSYPDFLDAPIQCGQVDLEEIRKHIPKGSKYVLRTHPKSGKEKYTIQAPDSQSKRGFPKGRMNLEDNNEEKRTAHREFKEEIGYMIPFEKLKSIGKTTTQNSELFLVEVDKATRDEMLCSIKKMDHEHVGELFDIKFERMEDVEKQMELDKKKNAKDRIYNVHALEAVDRLQKYLGLKPATPKRGNGGSSTSQYRNFSGLKSIQKGKGRRLTRLNRKKTTKKTRKSRR